MLRIMTDEEVKAGNERRAFLHASPFTIDNLTAVLMDSSTGDLGLYEVQARAKAHGILNYLRVITGADIPERRDEPPSPTTPHPKRKRKENRNLKILIACEFSGAGSLGFCFFIASRIP